jgi:hypothetical protein
MELLDLPTDIIVTILGFLTAEELSWSIPSVCSRLKHLSELDYLWKKHCKDDFDSVTLETSSWKQQYLALDGTRLEFNRDISSHKLEIRGNLAKSPSFNDRVGLASRRGCRFGGVRKRRYFEVTIDTVLGVSEFGVGVATRGVSLNHSLGHDEFGWCLFSLTNSLMETRHNGNKVSLPGTLSEGDVVGVLVDFPSRSVSFSVNGTVMGKPFTDLPNEPLFPAVSVRFIGASVSLHGYLPPPPSEKPSKKRKRPPEEEN